MRALTFLSAALVLSSCLLWSASPASATTIRVPQDRPTIQAGLQAAVLGDTVIVACGTYLEHDLMMASGTCLKSETGDPACVTIDGLAAGRLLSTVGGNGPTRIEGITFFHGYSQGDGGAILLGVPSARIRNCIFRENRAFGSGGATASGTSNPAFENCVFVQNEATDGGAIHLSGSSALIEGCTFSGNEAMFWGGAVFSQSASITTIRGCTISDNTANTGSGVWCVYDAHLFLENNVIAFGHGTGVHIWEDTSHLATVDIRCCDVFGNQGTNYGGRLQDQTGHDGNISYDPIFCDPSVEDFSLATASPCLPEHNSCDVLIGAYGVGCVVTGIDSRDPAAPRNLVLERNLPNPFGASTEIVFRLGAPQRVDLSVFDPSGRMVRELSRGETYATGENRVSWDGRDGSGREVPSGVYLYRIVSGADSRTGRMQLLR